MSAFIVVFAFPDTDMWYLAWFGLIPLLYSLFRSRNSLFASFLLGWLWGTLFFATTCSWLTFAPITYAGFPVFLAYFLLAIAAGIASIAIGVFAAIQAFMFRKFGAKAVFVAPFVWTALDFVRLWTTGNNWNAIGYSQAFNGLIGLSKYGGVFLVTFVVLFFNASAFFYIYKILESSNTKTDENGANNEKRYVVAFLPVVFAFLIGALLVAYLFRPSSKNPFSGIDSNTFVVAVQPNVPMSGLSSWRWDELREKQTKQARENLITPNFGGIAKIEAEHETSGTDVNLRASGYENKLRRNFASGTRLVVLPESPMNFQYDLDAEFRTFINEFAKRNNVSVLFNSAEPDRMRENGFYNSAVLINNQGKKLFQYNKIFLLPFGEFVPLPEFLAQYVPTMVGHFTRGTEYNVLRIGDVDAGLMICFESHFGSLSREFARKGADVLIEMTNDGYLGPTPVLRQHLASAVFRAVETNRPVLRVTNVGITTYISEKGEILDAAPVYRTAERVWAVRKSDKAETVYVRFGEWVPVVCLIVTLALILFGIFRNRTQIRTAE
ncbi:MAG: apolipoprotein N-acyltransferase [Pyrinomonadaceae bacterium]